MERVLGFCLIDSRSGGPEPSHVLPLVCPIHLAHPLGETRLRPRKASSQVDC